MLLVPFPKSAINTPVVPNPTVESTVNTVDPIETESINLVLGCIEKSSVTLSKFLSKSKLNL